MQVCFVIFFHFQKTTHFDQPLAALLAGSNPRVTAAPRRDTFKRKFDSIADNNILLINDKFLLNTEKKFEDYPQEPLNQTSDYFTLQNTVPSDRFTRDYA